MSDLLLVFLVGVLGSAHCVGMCGGFVVALGAQSGGARLPVRQGLYFMGKTATYALFGAAAGALGATVGLAFSGVQGALALALGAVMVGVGFSLCGVTKRLGIGDRWAQRFAGARLLTEGVGRLVAKGTGPATFGLGMLNGLLPCALVYGLLARAAATGSPVEGAAVMAVFGLGTVPALAFTGALGGLLTPARRQRFIRIGGVLVVAMGLLTAARGVSALGAGPADHDEPARNHTVLCLPGGPSSVAPEAPAR